MIPKIIEYCAKNRFLVLLVFSVIFGFGLWCLQHITLDAIPDLSDTQVIIYSRWDRSPDVVEDQVTYPIITALLGAPKVKSIRGFSDFGFSYVYVIFEDGTDPYWARSRTQEYLSKILPRLPASVQTELGPDATGIGWVYQYALVDESGKHSNAELRSFQDWNLKFALQSVSGVAEVAAIGGMVKQYQVSIDPNKLLGHAIPLSMVVEALKAANNDTGGRLVEFSGREFMVRSHGYLKSISDIENVALGSDPVTGMPVQVKHVASVAIGPDIRRGVSDLDGKGDAVGGIVIMRYGENALNVIDRVKERLSEIAPSFPEGVKLVTTYDRSDLIRRAIDTLKRTLIDEVIVVSLVILIFLWHVPSAIVPIVTIPVSIVIAFIPFYFMGLTANIMSLAGIAISIGILVDGAIVEVENAYKKLELWIAGGRKGDYHLVRLEALKEVGPSVFFSLLVIAVAFMPVFTLVDQEGRLFKPLAYSKNLAMAVAALLAITLDPALRMMFTRLDPFTFKPRWLARVADTVFVGKYYPEERHPISKRLFKIYEPVCRYVLKRRKAALIAAGLAMLSAIPAYLALGSEFMPPLNERAILYMPTTLPGIGVSEAERLLQVQDRILKSFPEVERVQGKIGRAESSTDPAPLSMVETTVLLKDESEWRKIDRWYSFLPELVQSPFRWIWPDHISWEELVADMDAKMQLAGWTNAWTMPIKNRIDMLSTGIRTPVGVKVFGPDLKTIERVGQDVEKALKDVAGTRSVFAERVAGGFFLDYDLRRDRLARYGLSVDEANMIIMTAIGGEPVTTTIEGRERYTVSVRYARELRDDLDELKRVLVPTSSGAQIPISEVADIHFTTGPAMIRDEDGMLAGYVYVDMAGRDVGGYVEEAKKVVASKVSVPTGYSLRWSGQYENMLRVRERLKIVLPVTLFLIFLLLYFNTKSALKAAIVMLAVPFSLIGAVWFLYFLDYNLSIAVWVGMIALMGLDAETGVFMLLYLDLSYDEAVKAGRMKNHDDLTEAIIHGAVKRIRPKMMTVIAAFVGLLPIMWSSATGSDMMKRIAAPMVGGLVTSFVLELLIYPVVFAMIKEKSLAAQFSSTNPQPGLNA
jgi:Cu(I)/Ag(I) efflux system membrane protein CusA/SilA